MDLAQIFLGQLPEAIYFALFMIYAKNLKTKKLLFTLTLIVEYFILKYIFIYSVWFNVTLTFMTYVILKLFYEEKAQITDIFTFCIGGLLLIFISAIFYFASMFLGINFDTAAILSKIVTFSVLFRVNYKFYRIQDLYRKLWNRNDAVEKKIKSITFRCWNLLIFNLMFYFISLCIEYVIKIH